MKKTSFMTEMVNHNIHFYIIILLMISVTAYISNIKFYGFSNLPHPAITVSTYNNSVESMLK